MNESVKVPHTSNVISHLKMEDGQENEFITGKRSILWGSDVYLERAAGKLPVLHLNLEECHVLNDGVVSKVVNLAEALPANFASKTVQIISPHFHVKIQAAGYSVSENDKCVITFDGQSWDLEGARVRGAWLYPDGKGLICVTTKRQILSFREKGNPQNLGEVPSSIAILEKSTISHLPGSSLCVLASLGDLALFDSGCFQGTYFLTSLPEEILVRIVNDFNYAVPQDFELDQSSEIKIRRLAKPTPLSLTMRNTRRGTKLHRLLEDLMYWGHKSLASLGQSTPSQVFTGILPPNVGASLLSESIYEEVSRLTDWDDLGLEKYLMLREIESKGWPVRTYTPLASQNAQSKTEDLLVMKLRDSRPRILQARVSKITQAKISLEVSGGFTIQCDQNLKPQRLNIPLALLDENSPAPSPHRQKTETSSIGTHENYQFGPRSAALLRAYSKAIAGIEMAPEDLEAFPKSATEVNQSFQREKPPRKNAPSHPGFLLDILRGDPELVNLQEVSESDRRILEILRARVNGMTLDAVGSTFSITRERVRQIIKKNGGPLFQELIDERENTIFANEAADKESLIQYVQSHPGIAFDELSVIFGRQKSEILKVLSKYETKLIVGSRRNMPRVKVWSDEQMLQALRDAQIYHFPLTTAAYENLISVGEINGPSIPSIINRFQTWKQACTNAGVEHVESNNNFSKLWSRGELLKFLQDFLLDPTTIESLADYEKWRNRQQERVPSETQLRTVLGGWPQACDEALSDLRANSWEASNVI